MFEEKITQLRKCAEIAGVSREIVGELSIPKARYELKVRARTKSGNQNFRLMGVLHCNPHSTGARPYKGGLRYHRNVSLDLLSALALDMTEKCALAELPFGGAKFGLVIDPAAYTEDELRTITERATELMMRNNLLHPDIYVPGPDIGTNANTMFWIYNTVAEWNVLARIPNVPAVVTGKPLEYDGCPGRDDATARGLLILLSEHLKLADLGGKSVAIQGFGNVGMNLAKLIASDFYLFRVVAVSDERGAIYNPEGLDVKEVVAHYEANKTLVGYRDNRYALPDPDELLYLPVEFLIPAAIENQIRKDNVGKVRARMVIEAANEAVTPEAQEALREQGVEFIPGIAANAGGVTVSYIEWSRNRGLRRHNVNLADDLQQVHKDLKKIMTNIIGQMWTYRKEHPNRTLAEAAHVLALENIARRLRTKHGIG